LTLPLRTMQSLDVTPVAKIRMHTSLRLGAGVSTSRSWSTSGGPYFSQTTAFTLSPFRRGSLRGTTAHESSSRTSRGLASAVGHWCAGVPMPPGHASAHPRARLLARPMPEAGALAHPRASARSADCDRSNRRQRGVTSPSLDDQRHLPGPRVATMLGDRAGGHDPRPMVGRRDRAEPLAACGNGRGRLGLPQRQERRV